MKPRRVIIAVEDEDGIVTGRAGTVDGCYINFDWPGGGTALVIDWVRVSSFKGWPSVDNVPPLEEIDN